MADTLQILFYVGALVFSFWWALLFSPLGTKRKKSPILLNILGMWIFLAIIRGFLLFNPEPVTSFFIPEPQNTLLFLVAGVGIVAIYLLMARRRKQRLIQKMDDVRTLDDLLTLAPTEFEEMIVELYRLSGHQATRTGSTGDNGIDIVIQAKNGEKWVVQCKRWRGSVGEPIIRDFYGAMQHVKADRGTLITTGYFTKPAQSWAKGKPVTLYNGQQLVEIWKKAKVKRQPVAANQALKTEH